MLGYLISCIPHSISQVRNDMAKERLTLRLDNKTRNQGSSQDYMTCRGGQSRDEEGTDEEGFPSWAIHRALRAAGGNSGPVPPPLFWPP